MQVAFPPVEGVKAVDEHRTNAGLIDEAYTMGYIGERVLDLTYGDGAFWEGACLDGDTKIRSVWTNDLFKPADYCYDFRCTEFNSAEFDTVVFDPPYKLAGTPASGAMDDAFGTDIERSRPEVYALLVGGLAECSRISKKWVLVKTMDQVSSGQVRWQTDIASDVMRALEFRKVDSLHLTGGRPQPAGRRQVHVRRNFSSLLVFKRGLGK